MHPLLGMDSTRRWIHTREQVVETCLEEHLPNHVGKSSGPDVFPEEPFEDGERRLSHPSEAVAHPPLPRLRVPEVLHHDALPGGAAPGST